MLRFTTGTIGRGKAVHAVHAHGDRQGKTACGKEATQVTDGTAADVTCRRCLVVLPSWGAELTAEEVNELNAKREAAIERERASTAQLVELVSGGNRTRLANPSRYALDYPALNGETVTEGHARYCDEFGHATRTVDGVVQWACPRCGDVVHAPAAPATMTYLASLFDSDKGHRYLFIGTQLSNGETFAWLQDSAGGQACVTLAELVQRFVAVPSGESSEAEVRWDQVWRSRYASSASQWFEVRVVELAGERVTVRSMSNGKRSALDIGMFVDLFRWTPEPGAESYGRPL